MDPYVETLRGDFLDAARSRGDEVGAVAESLVAPLDAAIRLTLLSALSDAADEITEALLPGTVEIRLRGLAPAFVVTSPVADGEGSGAGSGPGPERDAGVPQVPADDEDAATARVTFRPPVQLKARIDEAAAREGLSVNAWLVRLAAAALEPGQRPERRPRREARRFSGWAK